MVLNIVWMPGNVCWCVLRALKWEPRGYYALGKMLYEQWRRTARPPGSHVTNAVKNVALKWSFQLANDLHHIYLNLLALYTVFRTLMHNN